VQGASKTFSSRRDVFGRSREVVKAVNDVSIDLRPGETLGIVGESGSGKSTLGRLALRLIEADSGSVEFEGRDLRAASTAELRHVRSEMTVIFQDPYSSLDPRWSVQRIVGEPLRIHGSLSRSDERSAVDEALSRVGLDADASGRSPRAFSGGQRQRIGIARALITKPKLVFCDEPVSSLDVSTRAQVLSLLQDLQRDFGVAYLFVSHDLGVVEAMSERIAVMYLGSIVEIGSADQVAKNYRHPYTAALVSASPSPDPLAKRSHRRIVLNSDPPSPIDVPSGCPFHPRCALAKDICKTEVPPLVVRSDGHGVSCHVTNADVSLAGVALFERITDLSQRPSVSSSAAPHTTNRESPITNQPPGQSERTFP
jgi:oligopeptide/dipeptide ABC transporter ATP-binding protein